MKKYQFTEATPLIDFFEMFKDQIIGNQLKNLYIDFWPQYNRCTLSCEPVILELESCFVNIDYLIPSDLTLSIGTREEFEQDKLTSWILNVKNDVINYYDPEFSDVKKEEIDGCKITNIEIKRFSEAFEINPVSCEMRPDGGDYFSTIRLYLDSGAVLCFCGADSMSDGYILVWCE